MVGTWNGWLFSWATGPSVARRICARTWHNNDLLGNLIEINLLLLICGLYYGLKNCCARDINNRTVSDETTPLTRLKILSPNAWVSDYRGIIITKILVVSTKTRSRKNGTKFCNPELDTKYSYTNKPWLYEAPRRGSRPRPTFKNDLRKQK